ncbi:MAG TPA: HAD-IC family P-type ATPase [Dehalococcoidia bacterium]
MVRNEAETERGQTAWYREPPEAVLRRLATSRHGLTEKEAARRLAEHGPNRLTTDRGPTALGVLIHQVRDPIIYVLFGALALTLLLQEFIDAGIIFLAIGADVVIGFFQEYRAERAVRALLQLVAPQAVVVREGQPRALDPAVLVPGDLVLLTAGSRVPADLRLVETTELRVDESVLTGESSPVLKTTAPLDAPDVPVNEQTNVAFMGTSVVSGRATGVVVATGMDTELGRISADVQRVGRVHTPLQRQFESFSRLLGALAVAIALLTVASGLLVGRDLSEMVLFSAALVVAAIPEGLPVVVTLTLAVGVTRMARRHAVIRRLPAVETLGSATLIGSDKTGTLTKNEMTVQTVFAGGRHYRVTGTGYEPTGRFYDGEESVDPRDRRSLFLTLLGGVLCSDATLIRADSRWKVRGDPTEAALVVAAAKAGIDQREAADRYRRLDDIPFSSERAYMATLHEFGEGHAVFVKGAPERVTAFCDRELRDGEEAEMDRGALLEEARRLAAEGLRVLAVAYRPLPREANRIEPADVESGLTFLGFQGELDPPRPEAVEAIAAAKRAGIRVVMITGDYAVTARAIAERMGIVEPDHAPVLTGRDLARMSDDALEEAAGRVSIFARVAPEQKLRLVRAFRRRGEVVAITGDGVNDAPALKQADIGVAMGITGTDVAKEAADMVLTDDNFASIYAAVEEGRAVYDNIRKAVLFLIPTALGLIVTIMIAVISGRALPFRPAQVIWINLVTNGLQDMALAFEPAEPGLARRPPRDPREPLLTPTMLRRTALVGAVLAAGTLGVFLHVRGLHSLEYAQTAAVTTMVLFQNFHLFNSRSLDLSIFQIRFFSNWFLFFSLFSALTLHVLAVYWGPLQRVLGFEPLALDDWLISVAVASTVIVTVEAAKWFRQRTEARRRPPKRPA